MEDFANNKWLFKLLLFTSGIYITGANIRFANIGATMQLNCPNSRVNSWQSGKNDFLVLCEHDKPLKNLNLSISNRINISSDCSILTINNFTKEDAGTYACFIAKKGVYVKQEIHVAHRKLQINEANDANMVHGTEARMITLTCTLKGGSLNDILYWIKDNVTLTSGKPPSLKYTFIAHQTDHRKEFICKGTMKMNSYFLIEKVTVHLYLKPKVYITVSSTSSFAKIKKTVIVSQGQHLELKCLEKYNTSIDVVIFSWLFNGNVLTNDTKVIVLNSINPDMSGEYTCRAQNNAGIYYDALNITMGGRPQIPQHFQIIALKIEIIVKWQAGNSGGMLQTFLVEYRDRFESKWSAIIVEGKTSVVIGGLQMDTVYFVRMLSRNNVGKSNTTEEIIIKTGNHNLVIQNCSWEIGLTIGAAVVMILICLCGIKATPKCFCSNMAQNRNNISLGNETIPETHGGQYDEIDSVYYIPNINNVPEPSFDSTHFETLHLSSNDVNIDNITAANIGRGIFNHEILQRGTDSNILRVDNVSTRSSSDDSYLIPCQNYINHEIGFTDVHTLQIGEANFPVDGLSASNSENSETYIKSDHQYETLATTNIDDHCYESPIESY